MVVLLTQGAHFENHLSSHFDETRQVLYEGELEGCC